MTLSMASLCATSPECHRSVASTLPSLAPAPQVFVRRLEVVEAAHRWRPDVLYLIDNGKGRSVGIDDLQADARLGPLEEVAIACLPAHHHRVANLDGQARRLGGDGSTSPRCRLRTPPRMAAAAAWARKRRRAAAGNASPSAREWPAGRRRQRPWPHASSARPGASVSRPMLSPGWTVSMVSRPEGGAAGAGSGYKS